MFALSRDSRPLGGNDDVGGVIEERYLARKFNRRDCAESAKILSLAFGNTLLAVCLFVYRFSYYSCVFYNTIINIKIQISKAEFHCGNL
jgi:hypothetical protein